MELYEGRHLNTERIDHMIAQYSNDKLKLHYSDLLDSSSLTNLINKIQPDEIYNLQEPNLMCLSLFLIQS